MINYGSVCSGVEAASVAWHPIGWRASWLSEIEAFPSAVLAHHYPEVQNLGDLTKIARRILTGDVAAPDVLVGGTPCQAFSVAGLRQSLSDERGNLSLKFCELADAIDHVRVARGEDPAIIVWENVPGVLSTSDNAFGCFLGALSGEDCALQPSGKRWSDAGCVYGPERAVAWRILDAQYFGLAQRRRRVFVVASARNGFDPAAVLFERDGVRRDHPPSREAREGVASGIAGCLATGGRGRAYPGTSAQDAGEGYPIPSTGEISHFLNAGGMGRQDYETETLVTHTLIGGGFDDPVAFDTTQVTSAANRSNPKPGDPCHPLAAGAHPPAVAYRTTGNAGAYATGDQVGALTTSTDPNAQIVAFQPRIGRNGRGYAEDVFPALNGADAGATSDMRPCVATPSAVRRLTPLECERLQGFPDAYTDVPVRGKPAADGPRYKALGNSMAVPVMAWIGRRIQSILEATA